MVLSPPAEVTSPQQ